MDQGQIAATAPECDAFGTHGWVDPKKDMVGVFPIQMTGIDGRAKYGFMQMANAAVLD